MSWLIVVSIGSIPLAGQMARVRNRSSRAWLWTAAFIGPFAPVALAFLGELKGNGSGSDSDDGQRRPGRAHQVLDSDGIEFRKLPVVQARVVA